jgi:hypothetical protein
MSDEHDKETLAESSDGWRRRALHAEADLAAARVEIERLLAAPCGCACHHVAGHTDEPTVTMMLADTTRDLTAARAELDAAVRWTWLQATRIAVSAWSSDETLARYHAQAEKEPSDG